MIEDKSINNDLGQALLADEPYFESKPPPSILKNTLVKAFTSFYPTSCVQFITFWILLPIVYFTIIYLSGSSPTWIGVVPKQSDIDKTQFSEARAIQYINILTSRFPNRYIGQVNNLECISYLYDEINFLKSIFQKVKEKIYLNFR